VYKALSGGPLASVEEDAVGEGGSIALLLLMTVLYGSAVPVIFDPEAAAAWQGLPDTARHVIQRISNPRFLSGIL